MSATVNAIGRRVGIAILLAALALAGIFPSVEPGLAAADVAVTLKVSPTGTDAPACTDRNNPNLPACRNIQYAVENAQSGDTILVAQGTYTYSGLSNPNLCNNYTLNSSANYPVVCVVDKTLTIRGGYSDSNWTSPSIDPGLTIIDGQGTHRGVANMSSSTTVAKANLTLENMTIQNGFAQGFTGAQDWQKEGRGGGMLTDSTFTLRNVVFRNNRVYGASTNSGAGAVSVGGALSVSMPQPRNAVLEKVVFDNNYSQGGNGAERGGYAFAGAFYTYNVVMAASYITITNNTAQAGSAGGDGITNDGATADGLGGAISVHFQSRVVLSNVYAYGNRAIGGNAGSASGYQGGHGFGGAIYAEGATSLEVYDSLLTGNQAIGGGGNRAGLGGGGGLMDTVSALKLQRVRVVGNSARGGTGSAVRGSVGGGGLYLTNFDPNSNPTFSIANSVIADNYIEMGSGPSNPGGGGGGVWIQGAKVEFLNCTMAGNRMAQDLGYGSGMIIVSFSTPRPSAVTMSNCLISDHVDAAPSEGGIQSTIHLWGGNTLTFNYGIWANNTNNTNLENDPWCGEGPGTFYGLATMQEKTSAGYIAGYAPHYNYRLAASSPAINQAVNSSESLDFEKDSRPYDGAADIGADEYQPLRLMAAPGDGSAKVDWSGMASRLLGGVSYYELTVTCPQGGAAPQGITCGEPVRLSQVTSYNLTGLTNLATYQLMLQARGAGGTSLMASQTVTLIPTDQLVFLPVTLR